MVACTIAGILINLALPAMATMKRKADAAHVVADINAIRVAGFDAYADLQLWPASAAWGAIPTEMVNRLPQGFEFRYKTVEYRWQRWSLPNGMPTNPSQTILVTVELRSTDQSLMAAIRGLYKGGLAFGSATTATFVIE
ncbi:MAG: hypothetical protein HYS40_09230 [Gemmatimonadetes bacterium]|nr:hypothetical protein [Gemmatimonadota bacterium]